MRRRKTDTTAGDTAPDGGELGRRLSDEAAAEPDKQGVGRMLRDAAALVGARFNEITRNGLRPVLDELAATVKPATIEELRARYPDLDDDQIAHRLTDRSARMAATVAIAISGIVAGQEAAAAMTAAVPPAAAGTLGTIGITALSEVVVLFLVEAKLRIDLNALAGLPRTNPRELVTGIIGEVQAAGGLNHLRTRGLRHTLPEAAARRFIARIGPWIPARFARIVIPEVVAPVVGGVIAARLAAGQVRKAGRSHWEELRGPEPSTEVRWGDSGGRYDDDQAAGGAG
jgi:hypothetical protein